MRGHDLRGSEETGGKGRFRTGSSSCPFLWENGPAQPRHCASRENCPGDCEALGHVESPPLSPKTPQACLLPADLSEVHLAQFTFGSRW